jgi:hypothetical protein
MKKYKTIKVAMQDYIQETNDQIIKCDTPRTDALMQGGCIATNIMEHARQLERELTEAQALNNKLVKDLVATFGALDQMTQDAVSFKKSLSNYTRAIETL